MKRREFIKRSAATVPIITGGEQALNYPHDVTAATGGRTSGGTPLVAVAGSNDTALDNPAPLDELLSYRQVRDIVWLALDRDTSDRNLSSIVQKDSWVVVKPNIVVIPGSIAGESGEWPMVSQHREDTEHWGLVTDLRVIKALIEYLIEHIGPRRITIAEGPPWFSSGGKLKPESFIDGWHCTWDAFDNLSYAEIADELDGKRPGTAVDIVDLNEDDPVYAENYDPYGTELGAFQFVTGRDPDASSKDGPSRRRGIYLPKTIMERDVLITCPVLKVHAGVGVTLCMKNFVGCIHAPVYMDNPNDNLKVMIHQGNECNLMRGVADLASLIDPEYTVAEGFWASEQSFLSQNGLNINHNVIVAGGDVVAAEAVCMQLMGFNPLDSDVLRLCSKKRLGERHPDKIEVAGTPVRYLKRNYIRQNGYYSARGIRRWMMSGPVSSPLKNIRDLEINDGNSWQLMDGDDIMDNLEQLESMGIQDAMRYPLPGTAEARNGRLFYLAVTADAFQPDLCGQLLVGLDGGEFRAFLNGEVVRYDRPSLTYDPSPLGFLRFREGANLLLIEIRKTAGRKEPVRFAANICDFDGDRINGLIYEPENV
ncbi:DUF362 domain-containing protein [Candidatus Latescibacterota bacterium]